MTIENFKDLQISGITGSADRGGWEAQLGFVNAQAKAGFGRHVDLRDRLEGGGVWEDAFATAIDGTVIPQRLGFDRRGSSTNVVLTTAHAFLENAGLQGIYFAVVNPPTNPHQATSWNLGKIVLHILRDHTGIADSTPGGWVSLAGIDTLHSTSVDVFSIRQSNSIWSTIADIAKNEFYVRYMTRDDRFIYDLHPQFRTTPLDTVMEIAQHHILDDIEITFRDWVKTDQALLYALTDGGVILTSKYPATVGTDGRREKFSNLRCNSQARLDLLAERAYKFLNREYQVRFSMPGAIGTRFEQYDRIALTYSGTSINGVSVDWNEKKFWITEISIQPSGNFGATTTLMLDEENL